MDVFWNIVATVVGSLVTTAAGCCMRWLWKMAKALISIDARLATLSDEMKREFVTIGKRLDEHETRLLLLEREQPEETDP